MLNKEILYTVCGMDEDGNLVRLHTLSRTYSGPWMLVKKGREQLEQNMKADAAVAAQTRANAQKQYETTSGLIGEETAATTPGSLSPAAQAQLASDRDQIANTYNGIRQTAFRTLGQRGFGSAPSGFGLASENAADLGQATQDTAAYRNAQLATERQRQNAMATSAGLTGTEGSLGNSASGESTTAAVDRNKAGSTLGDIVGGVAQVAPIVAAPFTGGASLLASGLLNNPFSKMGSPNSGPNSAPAQVGKYGG